MTQDNPECMWCQPTQTCLKYDQNAFINFCSNLPCNQISTQSACEENHGNCRWDGTNCNEVPISCSAYLTSDGCTRQSDRCEWNGSLCLSKNRTPPPACERLSMGQCASHYPRCWWDREYHDVGACREATGMVPATPPPRPPPPPPRPPAGCRRYTSDCSISDRFQNAAVSCGSYYTDCSGGKCNCEWNDGFLGIGQGCKVSDEKCDSECCPRQGLPEKIFKCNHAKSRFECALLPGCAWNSTHSLCVRDDF